VDAQSRVHKVKLIPATRFQMLTIVSVTPLTANFSHVEALTGMIDVDKTIEL